MRILCSVLTVGVLAMVLAGCGGTPGSTPGSSGPATSNPGSSNPGTSDTDYAAKYKAAVEPLPHIAEIDASYKSSGGMGRSADVFMHADTSDRATMVEVLADAFPAIVDAAAGDPEVNLAIQVISADGASAVSPADLGYTGSGSLTSYRKFLGK